MHWDTIAVRLRRWLMIYGMPFYQRSDGKVLRVECGLSRLEHNPICQPTNEAYGLKFDYYIAMKTIDVRMSNSNSSDDVEVIRAYNSSNDYRNLTHHQEESLKSYYYRLKSLIPHGRKEVLDSLRIVFPDADIDSLGDSIMDLRSAVNRFGQFCLFDVRIYNLLERMSVLDPKNSHIYSNVYAVIKNNVEPNLSVGPMNYDIELGKYQLEYSNVAFWIMHSVSGLLSDILKSDGNKIVLCEISMKELGESNQIGELRRMIKDRAKNKPEPVEVMGQKYMSTKPFLQETIYDLSIDFLILHELIHIIEPHALWVDFLEQAGKKDVGDEFRKKFHHLTEMRADRGAIDGLLLHLEGPIRIPLALPLYFYICDYIIKRQVSYKGGAMQGDHPNLSDRLQDITSFLEKRLHLGLISPDEYHTWTYIVDVSKDITAVMIN